MNNEGERSLKIASIIIGVIVLLVAIAIGCKFYVGSNDISINREINLSAEETAMQVSLELKEGQQNIDSNFELSTNEILKAKEELAKEKLQKIFYVRVNNTQDVTLFMQFSVLPAKSEIGSYFSEAFLDAVRVKVYNSTDDIEMYEGSLSNLQDTILEIPIEATAAQKNDTRFRVYFDIDSDRAKELKDCTSQIVASWFIQDEEANALKGSQLPSLKIIVYAFIFAGAVTFILFYALHRHKKLDFLQIEQTEADGESVSEENEE